MEGVQFLLSQPVYINGMKIIPCLLCCLVIVGFMCAAVFCGGFAIIKKKYWLFIPAIISLMVYIIGFAHIREAVGPEFSHNEYVVVIQEGVDCKEFFETYEVIKQENDLITIKERSDDNT